MERRLLLVFALTFLVLIIAQPLLMKYGGKPADNQPKQQAQQQQQAPPSATPAAVETAPASGPRTAKPTVASKVAPTEQDTVIDTPVFRITFTNKGGVAKSWILKKYANDKGQPLDLVNQAASEAFGYPLSIFAYDDTVRNKANSALYLVSDTASQDKRTVVFEYADGEFQARKSFTFDLTPDSGSYVIKADIKVTRGGQTMAAFPAWPAGFGDQVSDISYGAARIDYLPVSTEKVQRLSPDKKGEKIGNGNTIKEPLYWGGALDQYFAAVFLPDNPQQAALVQFRNNISVPKDPAKPDPKETVKVEVLGAAVGNPSSETSTRVFVGPKNLDVLNSIHATGTVGQASGPDLGSLIDFGFFGIISKPLFLWLKWTQVHISPNWGWSIVILTVIINLALLPLRLSSMKSALKMQKVQPQINAIKKKYEKYSMRDPRRQEQNAEIQAVFKENGVNPVGGCLPMLIQMPFLWAFYTMLQVTAELRHAPWLWVKDLSAPDPYFVLPILIVASMFWMQKMTPNAGMDPAQQKMMNIFMPIMFGYISFKLAAGLGVYWVVGTIIQMVQQYVMNHTSMGREMRAEAEKRSRKQQLKGVVKK